MLYYPHYLLLFVFLCDYCVTFWSYMFQSYNVLSFVLIIVLYLIQHWIRYWILKWNEFISSHSIIFLCCVSYLLLLYSAFCSTLSTIVTFDFKQLYSSNIFWIWFSREFFFSFWSISIEGKVRMELIRMSIMICITF